MRHENSMWVFAAATLPMLGCEPSRERNQRVDLVASAGSSLNGSSLNGSSLNGSSLNGSSLNGQDLSTILASVSLSGVKLGGPVLDEAWIEGSEIRGSKGGATYEGADFEDSEFTGILGDGETVRLRVRQVTPPDAGDDVWRYAVSYRDEDAGTWWEICKDDAGPVPAVALSDRWDVRQGVEGGGDKIRDSGAFTFACSETSAISKCVSLGYKPWSTASGVSLDEHHQACVRLIRADYCGDGTSYTTEGEWVNLYDDVGVQQDEEDWIVEAEWDTAGARCFSPLNRSHSVVPCYDARTSLGCGSPSSFQTGTLLINETMTDGITE